MDVYAQLLDRSKRAHGAAFDALLADAQETLYGAQSGEFYHEAILALRRRMPRHPSLALTLGKRTMGAAGFEPATSRV